MLSFLCPLWPSFLVLAFHGNSTYGLVGLVVLFGLIVGWGIHCRRITARFQENLKAAGFDLLGTVPNLVAKKYPYLIAREGSPPHTPGTFFFFGAKPGNAFTTAQGARVQTLDLFLGFLLPYELALGGEALDKMRQQYRKQLITAEKLEDNSHFFLWARPHNPRQLARILKILHEVRAAATIK